MTMRRYRSLHLPKTIEECENDHIQFRCLDEEDNSGDTLPQILFIHDFNEHSVDWQERSNKYLQNLVNTKEFQNIAHHVEFIGFLRIYLDNWEPLLTTLKQSRANVETLYLEDCHLTEKGALSLGNILKTTPPTLTSNNNINECGFCIKKLTLGSLVGSMAWIDGFLDNTTITHLDQYNMPVLYDVIRFIQKSPQLENVFIFKLTNDEGKRGERGERFDINIDPDMQTLNRSKLRQLHIVFHEEEHFPLSLCRYIRCILNQAKNLKRLYLENLKSDIPYNFLRDAIYCRQLSLNQSDFDPHTLSFLIRGNNNGRDAAPAGKIKDLRLYDGKDVSKVQDLLRLVDLSLLDSFSVGCQRHRLDPFTIDCDRLLDVICPLIAENKGSKRLEITMNNANLSDFASRLASSLVGNDKIQKLYIGSWDFGNDVGPQQELLNAMNQMPRLQSWVVNVHESFLRTKRMKQIIAKWKEWIPRQLQSNWKIQEICPPFKLEDDIKKMLIFNKHWQKFLCCHDEMSSGIWSPALSQIKTIDSMFRVVREVPSLFQDVANAASELEKNRLPSFVVPHHVNCPGCRNQIEKQQKEQAHDI